MDEGTRPGGSPEVGADASPSRDDEQRSPAEIRRDIEETREQLGDTAEALAGKTDVKAQAKERVESVKQEAKAKIGELHGKASDAAPESAGSAASAVQEKVKANPLPAAAGVALIVGFALGRLTARG
jgi:ElaB/YqjD/DUF883 family membrane-anchored ribosome-binding protein